MNYNNPEMRKGALDAKHFLSRPIYSNRREVQIPKIIAINSDKSLMHI
jgi:hypothetical protein